MRLLFQVSNIKKIQNQVIRLANCLPNILNANVSAFKQNNPANRQTFDSCKVVSGALEIKLCYTYIRVKKLF